MGSPQRLDFGVSSDPGRYGADAGPMHWNCFAEPVRDGKHPAPLVACDGFHDFSTIANGGRIRGSIVAGAFLYVVSGTLLVKVDMSGVVTEIGGIPGTSFVSMARNDKPSSRQIVISADGNKYVVENDVLSPITDEDIPPTIAVAYLNQRIIYASANGEIVPSAVDEATDVSGLDVVVAEGKPDGLVGIVEHMGEIWALGVSTIQVFTDTGSATAPLRPHQAGVIPKGCLRLSTVAQLDLDLFWVGDDGVVYRARGYQFERISTHAIEEAIRTTQNKDNLEAMAFHSQGHAFYILSGDDWTWQFNRTTGSWDPRDSYGESRWRASLAADFNGSTIVGDFSSNKLYRLSRDAMDEAGSMMVWRARTSPVHAFPNQMCIDLMHLDFVTGVGLNSADPHRSDPKVGLRWSDDGGYTWSPQKVRSLGRLGERKTRITFDGLGETSATGRIFEIEASSPVIRSLMYAALEGDVNST